MFSQKSNNIKKDAPISSEARTLIDTTVVITGNVVAENDLRIDGTINGNITTKRRLVIGEKGLINGDVECAQAEIEGTIKGSVKATESAKLHKTAVVKGDIVALRLHTEFNAVIEGSIKVGAISNAKPTPQPAAVDTKS